MVGGPLDSGVLQGPGTCDQERTLDPVGAIEAAMGQQPMVANGNTQPADDIEQPEERPVQPGVMVEISVQRDPDHGTHSNGTKEDDGPDLVVASADRDRHTGGGEGDRRCAWSRTFWGRLIHKGLVVPKEVRIAPIVPTIRSMSI